MLAIISFFTSLVLFTLFISVFSLSNYSLSTAYRETFEKNNNYLLPISMYFENNKQRLNTKTQEKEYVGVVYEPELLKLSDKPKLEEKISGKVPIYEQYFYNAWFNCFNDDYKYDGTRFYSHSFKYMVTVDSFSQFNQPLAKGKLPENENEILIYDYMEESLLVGGVLEGSALNSTLYDRVSNVEFKVSGILKSSYKKYEYLKEKSNINLNDKYALSYLNELETIYCFKSYFNILPRNHKYYFNRVVPDHFGYSTIVNGEKIYEFSDLNNIVNTIITSTVNDKV